MLDLKVMMMGCSDYVIIIVGIHALFIYWDFSFIFLTHIVGIQALYMIGLKLVLKMYTYVTVSYITFYILLGYML